MHLDYAFGLCIYCFVECGSIGNALDIGFQIYHVVCDTTKAVAHETGMTQHDVHPGEVANQVVSAHKRFFDRSQCF
jgi:hypothetical protein